MGKSQTRRLREATKRFGREDWSRLASARADLSVLVRVRKAEAGLIAPTAVGPTFNGPTLVKRYSTCLSHQQNEAIYGRPWK